MSSQAGAAKHFLVTRSFVPCIDVPLLLQTALLLVSEIVQRAARTLAVSIWVGTIFFRSEPQKMPFHLKSLRGNVCIRLLVLGGRSALAAKTNYRA